MLKSIDRNIYLVNNKGSEESNIQPNMTIMWAKRIIFHLPKFFFCFFPGVADPCLLFRFLPFDGIFGNSVLTELTTWAPSDTGIKLAGLAGLAVGSWSEATAHGKFETTVKWK